MSATSSDHKMSSPNASAGGAGDGGLPQHPPRRKKMLSFEPNADFFVVDSTAAEVAATPSPQQQQQQQQTGATSGGGGVHRVRQRSYEKSSRRQTAAANLSGSEPSSSHPHMMGPIMIMQRKRVLSMPLCSDASNEFFLGVSPPPSAVPIVEERLSQDELADSSAVAAAAQQRDSRVPRSHRQRVRQNTAPISGRGFFQADDEEGNKDLTSSTDSAAAATRRAQRKKTRSFMGGVLARKAVAMDLLPADDAELGLYEFFHPQEQEKEKLIAGVVPFGLEHYGEESKDDEGEEEEGLEVGGKEEQVELTLHHQAKEEGEDAAVASAAAAGGKKQKKLFKPLIFSPRRIMPGGGGGGGHGVGHHGGGAFCDVVASTTHEGPSSTSIIVANGVGEGDKDVAIGTASDAVPLRENADESSNEKQHRDEFTDNAENSDSQDDNDSGKQKEHEGGSLNIIKATKKDYFYTGVLVVVMAAFVGVVVGWPTHLDETDSIFGPVGLACKTPCRGDVYDQNYFYSGDSRFHSGDVILLTPHIDATLTEESFLRLAIRGVQTNKTKWVSSDDVFGPASLGVGGKRITKQARVTVNWENPGEQHVIDVWSTTGSQELPPPYYESFPILVIHSDSTGESHEADNITHDAETYHEADASERARALSSVAGGVTTSAPDVPHHGELTFTLHVSTLSSLADQSVLIAALIMIFVYVFILLEVIHRTLVALFGSFIALFFLFLMHGGHTESIHTIMLHMEWSTLGLLFGMMLLVGELSHTGIFEWCAVRLLVASKGSFNRLMLLLCALVAISSAFLDNVTTMLLIAPVTIDMCGILGVDPRPYLIGEVLLSNVGGAATMIGDPPNIIIGSSFEEIGFVDFIVNLFPCIMIFCVPATIYLVLKIYRFYLTSEKMVTLDVGLLKKTYQVYDEPRLLIAGTTTFFVILMFFLHPIHHKDTAWIALLGAFVTIAFTNPHDVQDALRNHVEWDTLLFFAGLFVLVEVCAAMGLLQAIGDALASVIKGLPEESQLSVAISLILWVSAITSAFLDNIPYTATMIPVVRVLADELPDTLDVKILAWALSFGACLGGNGTLLGASANIVTAGLSTSKGFGISFLNFFYPGMVTTIVTVAIANIYMLVVFVWV